MDRVTKDRAAKFVDMLSAIGGTMGLLTGFSIISGVEILYFFLKIIWSLFRRQNINEQDQIVVNRCDYRTKPTFSIVIRKKEL